MIAATSATVRNLTSLSGVASAAIESPLPTELVRHAGHGASVTPVSSVSPVWKRASPCEPCQFGAGLAVGRAAAASCSYPHVSGHRRDGAGNLRCHSRAIASVLTQGYRRVTAGLILQPPIKALAVLLLAGPT